MMLTTDRNSESRKLVRSDYERPAEELARDLIGKLLVRRLGKVERRARIVETEAYVGPQDLACHASKGRTARTEVLYGPGGHAYVYLIYGMYDLLNVVAGGIGDAQAVLIRAAEPIDWNGDLSGPGKLARAMKITRRENGLDLTGDVLYILDDPSYHPHAVTTKRIGVEYAGRWKDAPLRFLDASSKAVSKRRRRILANAN